MATEDGKKQGESEIQRAEEEEKDTPTQFSWIKVHRIQSTADGGSHIDHYSLSIDREGPLGTLSEKFEAKAVEFRFTGGDYNLDWHCAPRYIPFFLSLVDSF